MAKEDPLYLPAVRQFLQPFGRIVERYLLRRYCKEGAWRSGSTQFTMFSIANIHASLLQAILTVNGYLATGVSPPEWVRQAIREHAAEMAGLCLILTDQAGCDLLDQEAVERAVNEVSLESIGDGSGGPGKKGEDDGNETTGG